MPEGHEARAGDESGAQQGYLGEFTGSGSGFMVPKCPKKVISVGDVDERAAVRARAPGDDEQEGEEGKTFQVASAIPGFLGASGSFF